MRYYLKLVIEGCFPGGGQDTEVKEITEREYLELGKQFFGWNID